MWRPEKKGFKRRILSNPARARGSGGKQAQTPRGRQSEITRRGDSNREESLSDPR